MLLPRTTCKSCKEKLGLNWLFAGFLYTVIFTVFFLGGLFVITRYDLPVAVAILGITFLLIGGSAARFGPLEPKTKWWAP